MDEDIRVSQKLGEGWWIVGKVMEGIGDAREEGKGKREKKTRRRRRVRRFRGGRAVGESDSSHPAHAAKDAS